jgi:predicted MFS family arabinose efflux permease
MQAAIGKKFLADYCGMSSAMAAAFTFVMMLMTMAMVLTGGFVSRWLENRRKPLIVLSVAFALVSMALLEVCLRFSLGRGWILLCYVILGLSSLASPVSTALMKESNPPDAVATSIGALNCACYLVVGLIIYLAGFAMDSFRSAAVTTATAVIYPRAAYETIFTSCFVLALAAFICALCLRESYGKPIYVEKSAGDCPKNPG